MYGVLLFSNLAGTLKPKLDVILLSLTPVGLTRGLSYFLLVSGIRSYELKQCLAAKLDSSQITHYNNRDCSSPGKGESRMSVSSSPRVHPEGPRILGFRALCFTPYVLRKPASSARRHELDQLKQTFNFYGSKNSFISTL